MKSIDPLLDSYLFDIINQAQTGITICDPNQEDNPLIFVNNTFTEIFGYSKEESLGKNCRFLQNDDKEQTNLKKIREAIENQTSTTTVLRNYTKNGDLVYNEIRISPIFDKNGTIKYFLGIQKDITDSMTFDNFQSMSHIFDENFHKDNYSLNEIRTILNELSIYQTELLAQNDELVEKDKNLLLLNNEFTTLFQEAPVPFLLVDKNLQIKKYNKESDKLFSFSTSNVSIKSMFKFVNKDSISLLVNWINNKQYEKDTLDIAMNCCNSHEHMFTIKAKPYSLDNELFIVSLVDVQKDYLIKKQMSEIIETQKQLSIEKDKIIQKKSRLITMGEMIDAIAHQWKQPLGIISLQTNFLYEMSEDKKYVKMEDVIECKDAVTSQINHLVTTLEIFRDFLRPSDKLEIFDLEDAINNVLVLTKDDMIQYNIDITVNFANEIYLKGIKKEFMHVILNILSNAKDIFVERDIKQRNIYIQTYTESDKQIIRIEDNAGGISENIIEDIFDNHTSGKTNGTGIGLHLSKQIIDKMDGSIKAFNSLFGTDKKQGATFEIVFNV